MTAKKIKGFFQRHIHEFQLSAQRWAVVTLLSADSGRLASFKKRVALLIYGLELKETLPRSVGALWIQPSKAARSAATFGLTYNLNHLGNVYSLKKEERNVTLNVERNVIEWLKKKLHVGEGVEGYITSGGTESNLFLMWTGRELLHNMGVQHPIVLHTGFTHYSVKKAARILALSTQEVAITELTYGLDVNHLEEVIVTFLRKKKGKVGVMLPITLGYSSTGCCDDLDGIVSAIKKIQKKHPRFHPFLWVDASMQGLPLLFLDPAFQDQFVFRHPEIYGYCLDFHKMGETPLPTGVVVYRKKLRAYIEQPIDYLIEKDATVLGSRPGFAALAIWFSICQRSDDAWTRRYSQLLHLKNTWEMELHRTSPSLRLETDEFSLTGALILKGKKALPKEIEETFMLNYCTVKYITAKGQTRQLKHYKVHFTDEIVWDFLKRLQTLP